jgi:phenylpyruvate tautomerase PptA (4-oxalocrotonate tautomerase family)
LGQHLAGEITANHQDLLGALPSKFDLSGSIFSKVTVRSWQLLGKRGIQNFPCSQKKGWVTRVTQLASKVLSKRRACHDRLEVCIALCFKSL